MKSHTFVSFIYTKKMSLQVSILTPERPFWNGQAEELILPTETGESTGCKSLSNRIRFKLVRITTKVTPTSAAMAKTRLLYPTKAKVMKMSLTAMAPMVLNLMR